MKCAKEEYTNNIKQYVKNVYSNYVDLKNDPEGICLSNLTLEEFVILQTEEIVYNFNEYSYTPIINYSLKKTFYAKYKIPEKTILSKEQLQILEKPFKELIPQLIALSVHIEELSIVPYAKTVIYSKFLIFTTYLFCWSYILYKSFKIELYYPILEIFFDKIEPFSGLILERIDLFC